VSRPEDGPDRADRGVSGTAGRTSRRTWPRRH